MSSIEKQIQELLRKKKKIDYLLYIIDLVKNDTKCLDFKEVQEDIISKVEPYLLGLATSIENDTSDKQPAIKAGEVIPGLTPEQAQALVQIADKVIEKTTVNQNKPSAPVRVQKDSNPQSHSDKMNFALSNRHLGNQRVQILNDHNAIMYGTVVGLDAPFVVVKTETGPTIQVPLEKVVLT